MIKFLIKGLLRDRSRSLFPVLTVSAGVFLTVILHAWISGTRSNMLEHNAHFDTGHVKVMTRAYAQEAAQMPNDLALLGVDSLIDALQLEKPQWIWTPRICFGGLLDIPDELDETRAQGPVMGLAVDLDAASPERKLLNLKQALVQGRLPEKRDEILISEHFSRELDVRPGDTATLISSTMYGAMAIHNFKIAGTVNFGIASMDRGAIVADLPDVQFALDMQDAAGEILGLSPDDVYHHQQALSLTRRFNERFENSGDEFAPVMLALSQQNGLEGMLNMVNTMSLTMIIIFVTVMSLVLWNAGLIGSIRRYGEIGVRLAIGEDKSHIYKTMLAESLAIGVAGSVLGTVVGLLVAWPMQELGIDFSSVMQNSTMMLSSRMHAQIMPMTFVIGLIPGLLATLFGASLAGIGIYKRETCQLFKELEV